MSTTVTYKGSTIATVENNTKTLTTQGKYLEGNIILTDVSGGGTPNLQTKTKTYTPTESAQTESVTADSGYDGLDTVNISVGAISSTYVGTGITRRSSSDLQAWDDVVVVPSGYYAQQEEKSVGYVSLATPTATKGAVSNHSVSVTPSITQSYGYTDGGTKTGTAVTVSASELVSGSETKTANGTYDVTNLAQLVVNVSGGGGSVTQDQDGYIVLPSTGGGGGITVEALNVTQNGTYTASTGKAYSPVTVNVSGSPSATQHTIYFEFTDSTDVTINAWYDSSFISDAITATTPTTYGQKTVSLAQLDGVTWYEPTPIPVGVELIDFTKTTNDYVVNSSGNVVAEQWYSVSDYTEIDPSMTFSYSGCYWFYIGFYDASKNTISALSMSSDGTQRPNDTNYCDGTLTPAKIPSNAKYVRITSTYNPDSTILSLIRTA